MKPEPQVTIVVPVSKSPAKKIAVEKSKKPPAPKKPKAPSTHPPVATMVVSAIKALKERNGSSLQAIKKYITNNFQCETDKLSPFIKKFLKNAVEKKQLVQTKGKGATGSFKINKAEEKAKILAEKPKKVSKKSKTDAEIRSEDKKTKPGIERKSPKKVESGDGKKTQKVGKKTKALVVKSSTSPKEKKATKSLKPKGVGKKSLILKKSTEKKLPAKKTEKSKKTLKKQASK